MERDPEKRLRMLEQHARSWRFAQPFYALGPIITAAGVAALAAGAHSALTQGTFAVAATALCAGSLAWAWSAYRRAIRIADFAAGRLPGWPFATYVFLTIAGLALFGIGMLAAAFAVWLTVVALVADVLFLGFYLRTRDIPPFVFYLLFLLVGIGLLV